jgi:hypothetical protein
MASRFTQYGAAQGADLALREMVAARLQAQMEAEKVAQERYKLQQDDRRISQGDRRIDVDQEQFGQTHGLAREQFEQGKQPKPQGPMSLSPGASLVDPVSGRILTTAPDRPDAPKGPMVLSPGAAVFDPTQGRILLRNPTTPAKSMDDELKEFEAKEQIKAKYGGSRPSLGAERQSLAYFNRAKQAIADISPIEPEIAKAGLWEQGQLQFAPNILQTQQQQSYRQAQRAFTEARLRKESGAAIPTAEYENDAKTYFAQPGDSPDTIEQKRRARAVVLDGLRFSAGKAYGEYYGGGQTETPGATEYDYDPATGQLVPRR